MNDTLQRFLFDELAVRGELVHLDASWKAITEHKDYPEPVRRLLGEALAATLLLSATLKFKGSLTLQLTGNGPVSMLVVEATATRTLRGIAHWQGEVPEKGLQAMLGKGGLVITIDPGEGRERYQGIVELSGDSLADALDNYLERSEQLATRMWLSVQGGRVAGLLLQKLPSESPDEDGWNRVTQLGQTVTSGELLELEPMEVIHRLFHEEDVRVFESEPVSFRCTCSRERVANALRSLGHAEVMAIIAEQEMVEVNCEFCNRSYRFDAVDAEQLFSENPPPDIRPTQH